MLREQLLYWLHEAAEIEHNGLVIRLQPFSLETIEHFKFLERPHNQDAHDADGFAPQRQYKRGVPPGRLSSGARDYATVGALY